MEIPDSSAAIYSEAKSEWRKILVFNFQPVLLRFFLDRFKEVKESPLVTSRAKSALSEFQDSLSQIPEWNVDKVQREASILLQAIQCDYVEDLIAAVFIGHTKILSAIRLHSKPRRPNVINITVPKPDHFMHRAMSECSRLLWSNVYLFSDSVPSLERQKNMNEVNHFLEEGILQAIRNLLPIKSILRDSLQEDDDATQTNTPETQNDIPESVVPETPIVPTNSVESDAPVAPVETPEELEVPENSIKQEPIESFEANNKQTLVIDTERSVGFTGFDSVYGTSGEAELIPSVENSDDIKIFGDIEELKLNEFEDLDAPNSTPLAADDYESL
jgi:Family of unknown function (DUF5764)